MFGLFNKYDTVKYIQSKTGFRCSDLSFQEFGEMKDSGAQESYQLDQLQSANNIKSSPLTMIGEFRYLFRHYEDKENKRAMSEIAKAVHIFLAEYENQIPEYAEMLINLPAEYHK